MPITVQCQCGKRFRTAEVNAGKTARCSSCLKPILVPSSDGLPEPDRDATPLPSRPSTIKRIAESARNAADELRTDAAFAAGEVAEAASKIRRKTADGQRQTADGHEIATDPPPADKSPHGPAQSPPARQSADEAGKILPHTLQPLADPDEWPDSPLNVLFGVIVAILLVAGILAIVATLGGSYHSNRFLSDNAIGATANSLERIEDKLDQLVGLASAAILLFSGLLLGLIMVVRRLRLDLTRSLRRCPVAPASASD